MKKIFSVAMMAMMALAAAVSTVSCTNDDNVPVVDNNVTLQASLDCNDIKTYDRMNVIYDAMTSFYQAKVGTTGTVRYTLDKNLGLYNFTFTTTKANLDAFKQALKSITAEETDAVVKKFEDVIHLSVSVSNGNEAVLKYSYENTEAIKAAAMEKESNKITYVDIEEGAWTANVYGVDYTVEFTSTKVDGHDYKAYLKINEQVIPGVVRGLESGSYVFSSDEKKKGWAVYYATLVAKDSSMNKMTTIVLDHGTPIVSREIFTKK